MRVNMSISPKEKCRRYLDACHELDRHPYWRSEFLPKISTEQLPNGGGYLYKVTEPDQVYLGDFVRLLRVFMSPGEPIYVDHIRGLVRRHLTDRRSIATLDEAYSKWRHHLQGGRLRIAHDGIDVLPEDAWKLFINSSFMHYDIEKRHQLETLEREKVDWMFRLVFLNYAHHASEYVLEIGTVIREAEQNDLIDWSLCVAG